MNTKKMINADVNLASEESKTVLGLYSIENSHYPHIARLNSLTIKLEIVRQFIILAYDARQDENFKSNYNKSIVDSTLEIALSYLYDVSDAITCAAEGNKLKFCPVDEYGDFIR